MFGDKVALVDSLKPQYIYVVANPKILRSEPFLRVQLSSCSTLNTWSATVKTERETKIYEID